MLLGTVPGNAKKSTGLSTNNFAEPVTVLVHIAGKNHQKARNFGDAVDAETFRTVLVAARRLLGQNTRKIARNEFPRKLPRKENPSLRRRPILRIRTDEGRKKYHSEL